MKKQVPALETKDTREAFKIFQFAKLEGIRGKDVYKRTPFASPIFGHSVKDVVTPPFLVKDTGDTTRRFDAFRTKKKLTEEEAIRKYGHKYYEFTTIVSNKTRSEVFGETDIVSSIEREEPPVEERRIIRPISRHVSAFSKPVQADSDEGIDVQDVSSEPLFVTDVDASDVDQEPDVQIFERPEPTTRFDQDVDSPPVPKGRSAFSDDPLQMDPDEALLEDSNLEPTRHVPNQPKDRYVLPDVRMFSKIDRNLDEQPDWLLDQINVINQTLDQFNIEGRVTGSKKGPTVTRYEISLEPGVNVKRIIGIEDNLMMNLASKSIRIEAPIPGKPYVGLEVPNVTPEIVAFGNVVDTKAFLQDNAHPLKVALGVDIDGENIYVDIANMPHGLIAGATNSGKSVCVNAMLASLLVKNTPDDLRLILIDPKMVELTPYNALPHLITPVITDAKVAAAALQWAVNEMDVRYRLFTSSLRSKDIRTYNDQIRRSLIEGKKLPHIVIVIDELADLMMVAPHDVESAIQRITQKARAAGIHLLVATQRPTTDVVKGTIKSNIPVRIAFKVASFIDSTTILDAAGAETLLGKGDMLLKQTDRPHRLQGAFISDEEIYTLTDYIRSMEGPNYIFGHEELVERIEYDDDDLDELFETVAYFVVENGSASINSIQKEFEVGFNRAQRLVDMLESKNIVSQSQGTKAREVLVNAIQLREILGKD
ncbi:MAG: DNA translocase FtsK [Acholeplasmataceae bacterium]|nr:DNA translocase FtsK [Acholeplasmataceae bacterium]